MSKSVTQNLSIDNVHDIEYNTHNTFQAVQMLKSVVPQEIGSSPKKTNKNTKQYSCPIFLPFGRFLFCWNLFLFIILIYSIVEIPYSIAFQVEASPNSPIAIIGFCIDLCLLLDIVLNFRTAYIDKFDRLRIIYDPKLIAKRYLKTWFIIDFLCSTPFTYIILTTNYSSSNGAAETLQFFRLLRIIKLVRIIKILKMFRIFREIHFFLPTNRRTRTLLKLIKIIILMLLTAHYFACLWYGIGDWAYYHKNNASWIEIIIDNEQDDAANFVKYSYAFYWAIVTLFTTGYGDIHAFNIYEQWTCSLGILIGSCFFAYFIGVITTGLGDDIRHQYKQERLEQARVFCSHYDLPPTLRRAVVTHCRYFNSYNYLFDYQITMNALPNYLRKDIERYLATSVLKELDIFESLPLSVVGQIALRLKSKSVGENQKLFEAGDIGKELFIQRTGKSQLMTNGYHRELKRGDVVGEDVILSRKRISTVICLSWSEFYVLNITDIVNVLQQNYDYQTAKQEWIKIKSMIKKTQRDSSIYKNSSEIIDEYKDDEEYHHPYHRHVRFKTIPPNVAEFETYVDPGYLSRDEPETPTNNDYSNNNNNDNNDRTFSEYELVLQQETEQEDRKRKEHQHDKGKNITFKAVKNMFLDRQTSHSRNKKIIKNLKKKTNRTSLTYTYSHVTPNIDDINIDDEMDINDYHDFDDNFTDVSAGFFPNKSQDICIVEDMEDNDNNDDRKDGDDNDKDEVQETKEVEIIEIKSNTIICHENEENEVVS